MDCTGTQDIYSYTSVSLLSHEHFNEDTQLWTLSCRLSSVIFPLDSNKNLRFPFHFSFRSAATLKSSSPSMLSSMMTSAPASMASSASSLFLTSTSRRRLNPPTLRACLIASLIEPSQEIFNKMKVYDPGNVCTGWPDMIILKHNHTREIMTMRINASNKHGILFHKAKPRSCFTSTCN